MATLGWWVVRNVSLRVSVQLTIVMATISFLMRIVCGWWSHAHVDNKAQRTEFKSELTICSVQKHGNHKIIAYDEIEQMKHKQVSTEWSEFILWTTWWSFNQPELMDISSKIFFQGSPRLDSPKKYAYIFPVWMHTTDFPGRIFTESEHGKECSNVQEYKILFFYSYLMTVNDVMMRNGRICSDI